MERKGKQGGLSLLASRNRIALDGSEEAESSYSSNELPSDSLTMVSPAQPAHGPLFTGLTINVALYGIMITQMYLYGITYKKDSLWIKSYVVALFLADTLNTVFLFVYLYDALIHHFDKPEFLQTANWVFATDPAMTAIIGSMAQLFFIWRLVSLRSSRWIIGFVSVCCVIGGLSGIGTSIAIHYVPHFADFQQFRSTVIVWLVLAASGDIAITATLVTYLRRHRTGVYATDNKIDEIIRMTIQTGLLTSVWAIVDLCVYLADPTGRHLIFNLPLSKLYTNSLMSSLNSRGGWREQSQSTRDRKGEETQQFNEVRLPVDGSESLRM